MLFAATSREEPPAHVLRFYYVSAMEADSADDDPHLEFYIENDGEAQRFGLHAHALSQPIDYRGPTPIPLFREIEGPEGIERISLGTLNFPSSWRGVLFLVLRHNENPKLPFRFIPVEYWGPSIPENHARIVNFCPIPLAARLSESRMLIPPNQQRDLDISSARTELPIHLALQRDSKWQMILSTAFPVPNNQQMLLIAFPDSAAFRTARILTIDDFPQIPAEP